MNDRSRRQALAWALRIFGVVFLFAVYPLTVLWPSGWAWHEGHSNYLQMIIGLYATLGVFLLLASRDPGRHVSLIAFTIWSSIVHGGIMAVQSLADPRHVGHLYGDVPALFIVAAMLAFLCPRAFTFRLAE
jgi:hypothetical protein